MNDLTIDIRDAAKTYRGKVRALRGVSMQVGRGEVFGLLGPNGAGKSTLIKILMTIVRPTRCAGTLLGAPIGRKDALAHVGYLPEHLRFPEYLTGAQTLDYLGGLQDVPRATRRSRGAESLELVGLTEWRAKKIGGYSKGMKQRLGVAQALMNDPDLILLDEPTDGVDPVGRRDIRNVMTELRARGKTVFINSHLLGEVEMICDRVAILVQGEVATQGALDELTEGGRRYEIEIAAPREGRFDPVAALGAVVKPTPPPKSPDAQPSAPAGKPPPRSLCVLPGGEPIELSGRVFRIATTDARVVQPLLDALRSEGAVVAGVRLVRPSLEDLFIQAVTDPGTGEADGVGAKPDEPKRTGGAE